MTCLINIVTSLLLISTATVGVVPDIDAHLVGSKPVNAVLHSSDVRAASGGATTEANHASRVVPVRAALELVGVSAGQADSVRRVVGLFDQAGLELPALVVRGSEDRAECGQHLGFHRQHETWSEIVLCKSDSSGFERSVVVHELAHAWAAFELSDTNKAAFQQVRGWEHWHDYEQAAWSDNGTEQAAEVIAWGVYDRVATIAFNFDGCADLTESYRALTGLDPAQGLTTLCEPAPAQVFS